MASIKELIESVKLDPKEATQVFNSIMESHVVRLLEPIVESRRKAIFNFGDGETYNFALSEALNFLLENLSEELDPSTLITLISDAATLYNISESDVSGALFTALNELDYFGENTESEEPTSEFDEEVSEFIGTLDTLIRENKGKVMAFGNGASRFVSSDDAAELLNNFIVSEDKNEFYTEALKDFKSFKAALNEAGPVVIQRKQHTEVSNALGKYNYHLDRDATKVASGGVLIYKNPQTFDTYTVDSLATPDNIHSHFANKPKVAA